eukprot:TRINITY_DN20745_c0_g1_i1.p1 TRINITY_DN20745_c0_g1~~TRINITY_DN20745_c0_g1_i1.p1  ORF type:complete len:121 (-),score=5.76 TRINITY_DN20745_c0_g1_i1:3-365(-)
MAGASVIRRSARRYVWLRRCARAASRQLRLSAVMGNRGTARWARCQRAFPAPAIEAAASRRGRGRGRAINTPVETSSADGRPTRDRGSLARPPCWSARRPRLSTTPQTGSVGHVKSSAGK